MKRLFWSLFLSSVLVGHSYAERIFTVNFSNKYLVAGQKFALKDINPSLPKNWDGFNYVVLEYRITTSQRFQLGFTTSGGYNELRIMSYVPNAWNRLAIPLKFFTHHPGAAVDLAATYNQPRFTGWINLGGHRCPMQGVDSVGFRICQPIGDQKLELRNIYLSREDPGDLYMDSRPAVDEFGQNNLLEYPHKIHSLSELQAEWRAEETEQVSTQPFNYSRYGGYLQKKLKATGFFRVEKYQKRWWMVDPDGYLFLSVGVDCVHPDNGGAVRSPNLRGGMFKQLPPTDVLQAIGAVNPKSGEPQYSFGKWNLFRRYGSDFKQKSLQMIEKRMNKWGINTVANWSSEDVKREVHKAFLHELHGLGLASDLMGLADVFDPNFKKNLDQAMDNQVTRLKDNPRLVGYFLGNEPAWLGREFALTQLIQNGHERPIKQALAAYLKQHGDTPDNRKAFIYDAFSQFINQANEALKRHDANHMNLGMRFGDPLSLDVNILKICAKAFDVFSFNCYDRSPRPEMLNRVKDLIDLPIIIGEYHFGTIERGYAQSLWQADNENDRALAYRYYTEQAYAHPSVVGTAYFQWADQDLTGRFDGENYHCGLVDVTDRPYSSQVEAMTETAKRLFDVHRGKLEPYNQKVPHLRGHGGIPNQWNK